MLEDHVREALAQAHIRPSRARGQHFLIDDNVLARVVEAADLHGGEAVLEIGPGLGTLTTALSSRCWRLYAFELDEQIVRYLRGWVLPETRNVVLEDVAFNKYALERVIAATQEAGRPLKIVTNLPYQISSAFLHTVAEYAQALELVVVMLQREVAQRVTAKSGDAGYGSFSIYLQTFLSAQWITAVPRGAFFPEPKVESAVLRLIPLRPEEQPQPRDRARYFRLVETVFRHRRKQMLNALGMAFPHLNTEACRAVLEKCGINPMARPGELSQADYVRLADAI